MYLVMHKNDIESNVIFEAVGGTLKRIDVKHKQLRK